jgi:hypothetical protein
VASAGEPGQIVDPTLDQRQPLRMAPLLDALLERPRFVDAVER